MEANGSSGENVQMCHLAGKASGWSFWTIWRTMFCGDSLLQIFKEEPWSYLCWTLCQGIWMFWISLDVFFLDIFGIKQGWFPSFSTPCSWALEFLGHRLLRSPPFRQDSACWLQWRWHLSSLSQGFRVATVLRGDPNDQVVQGSWWSCWLDYHC